jgi:hypothetical protein
MLPSNSKRSNSLFCCLLSGVYSSRNPFDILALRITVPNTIPFVSYYVSHLKYLSQIICQFILYYEYNIYYFLSMLPLSIKVVAMQVYAGQIINEVKAYCSLNILFCIENWYNYK